jgi:hypothetical protein
MIFYYSMFINCVRHFSVKVILSLSLLLTISGCDKKKDGVADVLCVTQGEAFNTSHTFVFLLPIIGCSGCQSQILDFVSESKNDLPCYVIMVGEMNKATRIKYEGLLKHAKIFYDESHCMGSGFNSYFPLLLEIRDEAVIKRTELAASDVSIELEMINKELNK